MLIGMPLTASLQLLYAFCLLSSFEAGSGGIPFRRRGRGYCHPPEREILHPSSRGDRDLHVHVEVNPRPQIQRVGLGSCAGKALNIKDNLCVER